ncbi:MAG TPA: penicillin-binding protein 2 [Longimicrobiaceae bacterium]|nr:penicillin-binding protein 2 [Longimicrobiaceae bacterium]
MLSDYTTSASSDPFHKHSRRRRASVAILLIALVLGTIGASFFRTQILHNADFVLRSQDNRLRVIPLPAPRGTVYDRNGEIIAETVTGYRLLLQPASVDSLRMWLEQVAVPLQLDSAQIAGIVAEFSRAPTRPVRVAKTLTFEEISWIEEHRTEFTGILLQPHPVRRYPGGEAVAHLIGHVAEISERELADSAWSDYQLGQQIGKAGLERQYEGHLGGTMGERYVEVDARGRTVGPVAQEVIISPTPGKDLHLTIDLELQRFARSIFPAEMRGAIVALTPTTGEVLALYSHPTFDPNVLGDGMSLPAWKALNSDPEKPLLPRARAGIYAPGSTWKLATAIIGLEMGVVTPESRMPIACTGGLTYAGRYSRCWKSEGHGSLDLGGAIAHSCNVYFYQLGIRLGLNQLAQEGVRLGFNRSTGIDLPSESSGFFPEDADAYEERFGWKPTPSEVMSLAIGQGPNAQTPLRMAQFYSALAGDGTARVPHLRAGIQTPVETDLRVSPATLEALRAGLAAVTEPGGTAFSSSLERWKLYGKTGTAENSADGDRPHAWFTGFAGPPGADPEIVVAVLVEFGEHGSSAAAPIAAKIAEFYLDKTHE